MTSSHALKKPLVTDMASKNCTRCKRALLVDGVHMGIPFAHWKSQSAVGESFETRLYCSSCYDLVTIDLDHKTTKLDLFKKESDSE